MAEVRTKETTKKTEAKVEAKAAPKKVAAVVEVKKPVVKRSGGLSAPVYSLLGKEAGSLELPKEIFGVEVNNKLLAQAMRVYMSNQKGHYSNTKTRGQVEGSTRKIYAQKGTGRARHGGIRAPIFVGGGIALGPKFRKIELELPKKMKKAALLSALSQKASVSEVFALDAAEKATGKTSEMAKLFKGLGKKSVLVVAGEKMDNLFRSVKNIKGVEFESADQINAFEVIKHKSLVLTRDAVEKLQSRFAEKKESDESKESKESKVVKVSKGTKLVKMAKVVRVAKPKNFVKKEKKA